MYITLFTDEKNNEAIQNCSGSTCKDIISNLDNLTLRIENGDFTEQITQLSNELAKSQSNYTSLFNGCGKDIDKLTAEKEQLSQKLEESEKRIEELTTENEQLKQINAEAEERIKELTTN